MTTRRKPTLVFGVAGVANWLGVKAGTVTQWLEREKRGDVPPTPTPDILLSPGRSGVPDRGWLLNRRTEWLEWRASLPGRGAPGVPDHATPTTRRPAMDDRHVMTGPEHYLVTERGFQRDIRCDDCRAGKLGDRFTLAIEEGIAAITCGACGGLPDQIVELENIYFEMKPIAVSVAEWAECNNPGGTHIDAECDHGWGIVITPRAD